jgi:DNA-binding MarR family transcriptional regulator
LTKFIAEHLINEHEHKLTLTGKGIELHSACFEKQKAFRQSLMNDISEHDYQTTVMTLQKVVDNITKSHFANYHS